MAIRYALLSANGSLMVYPAGVKPEFDWNEGKRWPKAQRVSLVAVRVEDVRKVRRPRTRRAPG